MVIRWKGRREMVFLFAALISLSFFSIPADAQIPRVISYQGYLTNASGVPINGTTPMIFSIYNVLAGGTALWSEARNVTVADGIYNVNLGEVTPISLTFDVPYYLGVAAGADAEMTPRTPLTAVGYAFRAQNADNAGGWIYSPGTIALGTGTDRVGIGTASPTEKLEVGGNLKLGGDLKTDRWLNSSSNTFIGVGVAGAGQLTHNADIEGWENTGLGYYALHSITTGFWNTAVGYNALTYNTEGYNNSAIGDSALRDNTTGMHNSSLGTLALYANRTGSSNSALGVQALKLNETGNSNTAVGVDAGYHNVAGSNNVFLGAGAGYAETGSNRLYIGNAASDTLIYGQFDNKRVCVSCTDPAAALDVNGPVRVRAQSYVWISGNGVRPYQQADSTIINMNTSGGARITRGATAGNKNVMLPITVTGPLFGRNVTITDLDVYWAGETEFEGITAVLLRRQTGVSLSTEQYASLLHDASAHGCLSNANPTGCVIHYDLTANNVLTANSGVLYLTLELYFSSSTARIDIGGVKLTLQHE